jgi:Fur family transcriptional regulator, iron response regulator
MFARQNTTAGHAMPEHRPFAHALKRLQEKGLRPTRQRLALARLLFSVPHHRHVSAEQLHTEAVTAGVRVSLATVYNTLHQFVDVGLLRPVVIDAGRTCFDTNVQGQYHVVFSEGGRLLDLDGGQVTVSGLPTPPDGHRIESVDVVVRLRPVAA